MTDYTPEGKEIETVTMWLSFAEGDVPLTLDLTEFKHGLKQAQATAERLQAAMERRAARRKLIQESIETFFEFDEAMENVRRLCSATPDEVAEASERIRNLGKGGE